MSPRFLKVVAAAYAAVACATLLAVAGCQPAGAGVRGMAVEIPGLAELNKGDAAQVTSLSCPSAGNCLAGGFYTNAAGWAQPFVASEVAGSWGTAIEVPGATALDKGGFARISAVSCGAPGNCAVGGIYGNGSSLSHAFLATEVKGSWGVATEVPGTAALNNADPANTDGGAAVSAVSCTSPGNCTAAGYYAAYAPRSGTTLPFVISEVNGTWGTAIEVPGIDALSGGGAATIISLSCASPGNCSAGGSYRGPFLSPTFNKHQAFLVSQVRGTWQAAVEVPGTAALNTAGMAEVESVSCGAPGNCVAGGYYSQAPDELDRAFMASEVNGAWETATPVSGISGPAEVSSVSCTSAGDCSAVGTGGRVSGLFQVSEVNGRWRMAGPIRLTKAVRRAGILGVISVSCASAGNCAAGGATFVVAENGGTWGIGRLVPGPAAFTKIAPLEITTVSCAPAAGCAAGGDYADRRSGDRRANGTQAFVVSLS